jgi:ERF superfamily
MNDLTSENINELASALCKAQGEIKSAVEDKVNPHFKSSYASLDSVWQACRDALSKNGLSVVQLPVVDGEFLFLTTMLIHTSGQWIKSKMPITSAKMTPQAIGSGMTYMRRYCLAAMVGVAPGDDDGNEAQSAQGKNFAAVKFAVTPAKLEKVVGEKDISPDAIEEFKTFYSIGTGSTYDQYIDALSEKTKKTRDEMILIALKNETYFISQYNKWKESLPMEKVG